MNTQAKVFILEDDEVTRSRLIDKVEESERFSVIGAAANLAEADELLDLHAPDLLLLDLQLPDGER